MQESSVWIELVKAIPSSPWRRRGAWGRGNRRAPSASVCNGPEDSKSGTPYQRAETRCLKMTHQM